MGALLQEARFGLRLMARTPLLSAVVILTLGFGIGANTAIFSFVNALLLRPYPFADLDRLVVVSERHPQQGGQASVRPSDAGHPLAPADFLDLRRESGRFESLAAIRQREFTLEGQDEPERLRAALVTPELFGLLREDAALGRTLRAEEGEPGRDGVVVVSHGLWQRRLGAAADVLGRALVLNGRPYTVVGVMPAAFDYPAGGVELWAPLALGDKEKEDRAALSLRVVGRLARGVGLEAARAELSAIARRLELAHPRSNAGRTFVAVRLREQQAGLTGPFAALLQGAALLVLLIACANVGGLLLARGLVRRREMALRAALGAGRGRVVRQLLMESLALALPGGVAALGMAALGVRIIRSSVPPDITKWVGGWSAISLDARAFAFALLATLVAALLTGLLPALAAARVGLMEVLREGGAITRARVRGRSLLVAGQMGLALVLLVNASLMAGGFGRLLRGYEAHHPPGVVTFRLRLPETRYPAGRPVTELYERLLSDLAAVPGVESAAAVAQLPGDLGPVPGGPVSVRGRSAPGDLDLPMADYQAASADYFRTLRVRILAGRSLSPMDAAGAPPVAVVSASMAARLWPGQDAVGQYVKPGRPGDPGPWREVVGVVEDVTQYWFDKEPRSTLYLPHAQQPRAAMFVLVRSRGGAPVPVAALRARVRALDPGLPLDEVRTLRQVVDDGMAFLRLAAGLLLAMGGVSLALSALGVYAIMAQDVAQRTQEIGVRLALGAGRGEVRRMVLGRALKLAGLAFLAGIPAAAALSRVMAASLFGVVRPDAALFALFGGGLLLLALLAAWAPARRAAALDPVAALRAG